MIAETDRPLELPRAVRQSSLVERLADRLGVTANARTVYGDAVEREGVTVIPVAKVSFGFGGGGGIQGAREGSGGGGGLRAEPLGYIEIKNGEQGSGAYGSRARPFHS